ncbi:MAG: PIN domain-containing protein [Nanoarchaeota archaeon]|nr:PIN domain-containing protein [Nanoarchaeota archaeon]
MAQKRYSVDSCIWLNLFKKEGDPTKGTPYWKLAQDFIDHVEEENGIIIVSTIVLKELSYKLGGKFEEVQQFFKESGFIHLVKTTTEDYNVAREFEQRHHSLSFYDYLHVAIAQRLNVPFITRDADLLAFAQSKIAVFKPEDLFR